MVYRAGFPSSWLRGPSLDNAQKRWPPEKQRPPMSHRRMDWVSGKRGLGVCWAEEGGLGPHLWFLIFARLGRRLNRELSDHSCTSGSRGRGLQRPPLLPPEGRAGSALRGGAGGVLCGTGLGTGGLDSGGVWPDPRTPRSSKPRDCVLPGPHALPSAAFLPDASLRRPSAPSLLLLLFVRTRT